MRRPILKAFAAVSIGLLSTSSGLAQTAASRIDDALQNITAITRPEKVGYATIWDGNKYVQCRRQPNRDMRCEAAGSVLQPSLQRVLTPERAGKLLSLGWVQDPAFGNHAQTFPADMATAAIASRIAATLAEAYDASIDKLETRTAWVADIPCPPRNGRSQNLAGIVNDDPAMRPTALRGCTFTPDSQRMQIAKSSSDLIGIYGAQVTAEIQRLRINAAQKVFVILDAGIGYIQCASDAVDREIYCEAQSADSWEALAAVLTPERVSYLRNAGYSEPGRTPNYSKSYPFGEFTDAAIASEILTILYEAYGYRGATKLKTIAK